MQAVKNAVIITRAPKTDFRKDYVTLPANYGSQAYFDRPDIRAIYDLVHENLTSLDWQTSFTRKLKDKKVVIKPNLVTVYSNMGMVEREYPETTDPRLLDAIVAWLKPYTNQIVIAESSGRGFPTRGAMRMVGIDRLARHHGVEWMALEEQPTDRYLVPQARVQKEIIVPQIFSEVINKTAFYISVPKMKTNLYTGVTLGFKNAMGTLPYNLRQRNHNFALDEKLVDMLYLFQPDLTIIDGLVGGEGNCPAPVDPVDSCVIISGTNSLETDRVATRMMGFDPQAIRLITCADDAGFGDPNVVVVGQQTVTPFRAADPSLFSPRFREQFPNVLVLVGRSLPHSPVLSPEGSYTSAHAEEMALGCRGGCLASMRFAFEMMYREGLRTNFKLTVILGDGAMINGQRIYLDGAGKPYTEEEIAHLPGKKLAIGSCTKHLAGVVDRHVNGCMPYPNQPHVALHQITGTICRVLTPRNRHLLPLLFATLQLCEIRKRLYRAGLRMDSELSMNNNLVVPPELVQDLLNSRIVPSSLPPLTPEEVQQLCARENRAVLATFLG